MIPKTIEDICNLFDAIVCTDIKPRGFAKELEPVFYIGQNDSPGLWGFSLTPAFFSRKALERYCASAKGRTEINKRARDLWPDWNSIDECWQQR